MGIRVRDAANPSMEPRPTALLQLLTVTTLYDSSPVVVALPGNL